VATAACTAIASPAAEASAETSPTSKSTAAAEAATEAATHASEATSSAEAHATGTGEPILADLEHAALPVVAIELLNSISGVIGTLENDNA
jgi:hypothetical protein